MMMMLRSLLAVAMLCYAPPAVPQTAVQLESVPLVDCMRGAGTAFRIGPNILLSVKHVTNQVGCQIDGAPIRVSYTSAKADFSMLSDDRSGNWLKADCRGFIPGHLYLAIGHARGLDALAIVPMIATGDTEDGLAVLVGVFTAQPGQSGGPVIDAQTHEVVGTVNAADWEGGTTFSVPLKDTPVCKGTLA
jgi:hypothetical protein